MKFFIPLGFHERDGDHPNYHSGSIYGPYADQAAVDEVLQRLWPNDKKEQFLVFDGHIQGVKPSPKELPEEQKRASGDIENYRVDDAGKYWCKTCDGPILAVRVAHPIHFTEMPGAGAGECEYSEAPYCPNCERRPSSSGLPVQVPIFAH